MEGLLGGRDPDLRGPIPGGAGAAVSPDERPLGMKPEEKKAPLRRDDFSERKEPSFGNLDISGDSESLRF